MAGETLRDLVVSLSLESKNFTTNIKHVNAEIAEAKSKFELAQSGVQGFEGAAAKAASRMTMLEETLSLQNKLIEQYQGQLAATEAKLSNFMARHEQLSRQYATSAAAIEAAAASHRNLAAALREETNNGGDPARIAQLTAELETSKNVLSSLRENHSNLGAQLTANERNQQKLADAITTGNTKLNEAQAAANNTAAAIDTLNNSLSPTEQAWKNFADTSSYAQVLMRSFAAEIKQAGADFQLFAAQSRETPESLVMLTAKLQELQQVYQSQGNMVQAATSAYEAARGQMELMQASASGNVTQWFEQQAAVQAAELELTRAQTAYAETGRAISELEQKLSAAGQYMSTLGSLSGQIATDMELYSSKIDAAKSYLESYQSTTSAVPGSVDYLNSSLEILNQQLSAQSEYVQLAKEALDNENEKYRVMAASVGVSSDALDRQSIVVNNATIAYNRASVAEEELRSKILDIRIALTSEEQAWSAQAKKVEQADNAIQNYVNGMKLLKAQNANAQSQVSSNASEYDKLQSKLTSLRAEYAKCQEGLKLYATALQEAKTAMDLANQGSDPTRIAEAAAKYNEAAIAMQNAEAEANGLKGEIADSERELRTASNAAQEFGDKLEAVGDSISSVGQSLYNSLTKPIMQFASESTQAFMTMESSVARLRQVTDATDEQYASVTNAAREMSEELGISAASIVNVMTEVGRLGIDITGNGEDFIQFTEVVERMSLTLGVNAEEAGTSVARFFTLMGNSVDEATNYGSAVTYLANNYATTASEIIQMSQGLAGAAATVGMSSQDVLGISTALTSVGITAGRGATTFSQALIKIETAVQTGNKYLDDFAMVAGMSSEEFVEAWKTNPTEAFTAFILGLANMDSATSSSIAALQECGINTTRLTDSLLRITNNTDNFTSAIRDANAAWQDTTILGTTSDKVVNTLQTRLNALKESFKNLKETVGKDLSKTFENLLKTGKNVIDWFKNMNSSTRHTIEVIAGLVAAIGPLLMAIGFIGTYVGKSISMFVTFGRSIVTATQAMSAFIATPFGIALTAVAAAAAIAVAAINSYYNSTKIAKVTQDALNKSIEQWTEDARTAFETARGMAGFGLEDEDFTPPDSTTGSWLSDTIATWNDGKAETDEIVDSTVQTFKDGTSAITTAMEGIKGDPELVPDSMISEWEADVARLHEIDAEVEELIRKRQNRKLTDGDQQKLAGLEGERDAIVVKWKLEPVEDPDTGFDKISEGVDAALSRGADKSTTYNDAISASIQGMGSYMSSLNAWYDEEYGKIQQIEDENERNSALSSLNAEYAYKAKIGVSEFSSAIDHAGEATGVFADGGKYQPTIDALREISEIIGRIQNGEAEDGDVARLAELTSGLDESAVVELNTSLSAAEMSGVELTGTLADVKGYLDYIKDVANDPAFTLFVNGDTDGSVMDTIRSMFGSNLDQETIQVYATLNCDGLTLAYTNWANGNHTPIIPTVGEVNASNLSVTGKVAVEGDIIQLTADTGGVYTLPSNWKIKAGGVIDYVVTSEDGVQTYETPIVEVEGKLMYVDPNTGEQFEITSATVDVAGQLTSVVTTEGTTYDVKVDAEIGKVIVTENTEIPTIEVNAVPTYTNNPDGAYTNSAYSGPAFNSSASSLQSASSGQSGSWWVSALSGLDPGSLLSKTESFVQCANNLESAWGPFKLLFMGDYNRSLMELQTLMNVDTNGMTGFEQMAQYVTSGLQLLAEGKMSAEELPEFLKNLELIFEFMNLTKGKLTDSGFTFEQEFAKAFGEYGWNVDETNVIDAVSSMGTQAVNSAKDLGGDVAAGVGEGMEKYSFYDDASGMATNVSDASDSATGRGSPCELTKPLGRDVAGGVGEGMTQFDFSTDAGTMAANMMSAITSALSTNTGGDTDGAASDAVGGIEKALSSAGDGTSSIGKNMMDGIKNGIEQGRSGVINAAAKAVEDAIIAAKAKADIRSPSRVMKDEVGVMLMRGMGVGIDKEAAATAKTLANATRYVMNGASGYVGSTYNQNRTYNQNSNLTLNIDGLAVRDEADVRALAVELANLNRRQNQRVGVMA